MDSTWDIWVVSAAGGPSRRVTGPPFDEVIPTWSADGKWLYYTLFRDGVYSIWKVPLEGGEPIQAAPRGSCIGFESRDGKRLLYLDSSDDAGLYAQPLGGGAPQLLFKGVRNRAIAEAASGIYFISRSGSIYSLNYYDFHAAASKPIRTLGIVTYLGLSASPDGRNVIYTAPSTLNGDLMLIDGFR